MSIHVFLLLCGSSVLFYADDVVITYVVPVIAYNWYSQGRHHEWQMALLVCCLHALLAVIIARLYYYQSPLILH